MATSNETCALSSDELDAVSGGVQSDGCTKTGGCRSYYGSAHDTAPEGASMRAPQGVPNDPL